MASVQSISDMPAQGQLPGNLSKDQVSRIYAQYQQMRAQGVPESNPEFIKVRNVLAMVQKQNQYIQKVRAQQARQQSMAEGQAPQQNGAAMAMNGTKPPAPSASTPTSAAPASATQTATPTGQAPSGPGQTPSNAAPLTKEQLAMLRAQIGAFKHLSKGLPLPANVQQQIYGHHMKKPQSVTDAVNAAAQVLDNASRATSVGGAVQEPRNLPRLPDTFIEPWNSEAFREVNYMSHTQRKNRPYLATIMPQGVDIDAVQQSMQEMRKEREIILYNRLTARKAELEKLNANIGSWDTSKTDTPEDDGKVKLALVIEQKKLNLLEKQRKLRREIAQQMIHADNLAMTANRTIYRRRSEERRVGKECRN